ncbi:hypothetical protein T10_12710 [Trichinella papuae]|uniref:Uncharacterized protein n=1 Tax=Trichinella papuae TaxID=268474 RepID=A0A0V1MLG6_9BILA|nr:hypothetical protein T10_12710 [Trichinella papuae]
MCYWFNWYKIAVFRHCHHFQLLVTLAGLFKVSNVDSGSTTAATAGLFSASRSLVPTATSEVDVATVAVAVVAAAAVAVVVVLSVVVVVVVSAGVAAAAFGSATATLLSTDGTFSTAAALLSTGVAGTAEGAA